MCRRGSADIALLLNDSAAKCESFRLCARKEMQRREVMLSFIAVFGFLLSVALMSRLSCCLSGKYSAADPSVSPILSFRFSVLALVFNPRLFCTQTYLTLCCLNEISRKVCRLIAIVWIRAFQWQKFQSQKWQWQKFRLRRCWNQECLWQECQRQEKNGASQSDNFLPAVFVNVVFQNSLPEFINRQGGISCR